MLNIKKTLNQRLKRQKRVRGKIHGTSQRPRLTVFRSNKHLYLQVVDDTQAKTLAASSDIKQDGKSKESKTERAVLIAQELLKVLKTKKIDSLVLDRSYYKYHGRVKKVVEILREGGINI